MNKLLSGSLAGCLATIPMTWTMELLYRRLPRRERYPLPPRQVTEQVARNAGLAEELDERQWRAATLVSHFGMGTAMGALWVPVGRQLPLPTPLAGAAFGLGVWAANYLGLLPAIGLLAPANKHPVRRTATMIAAHAVWGVTTSVLAGALTTDNSASRP
jgi:uncharacterized membrane protein YagU involved in acid resistance